MGFRNMTKKGRVMQINNVPNGWSIKRLGDILSITSCKRVHESEWTTSGVPFYRARELVALHDKLPIEPLFISEELYEKNTKLSGCIQAGDLLVTGVGTIGIQYLVKPGDRFYFKDGNIIWLKNEDKINGEFLYYSFDGQFIRKQILNAAGVGTVGTYTIDNAKKTYVMVPPIEEQEKIAEILGTWDRAIEELTDLIAEKKELRKGLANRLLNVLTWNDIELSDLLDYEQPTKYLVTKILDYDAQKIPVLTANKAFILGSTDDTTGVYSKQDCIIFDDFTTDMKYVDFKFKVKSSAIKILTPRENVNLKFVFEQMQRLKLPIGGHKRYWLSEYQYLTIKIPDDDTQSKIVSILSKADAEIDLLNQRLDVLKEQKRGLMQKLLTGEVRVKVDVE